MKTDRNTIEAIKRDHDLVATMKGRGIVLKKQGKQYMGRCPFHEDKKPSLSVDATKGLWHCFGCGAGGDVLGFLSKIEGKSLSTLLQEFSAQSNGAAAPSSLRTGQANRPTVDASASHESRDALSPSQIKLLRRVVEFYQGIFAKDPRGQKYLEGRGVTDMDALRDFGVGYANGSLLEALPPEGELLSDLKTLGMLTDKGHEFFSDCIVIPLWDLNGTVTGLYGRRITDSEPHHLYLPGPRRGLVNWQAAKRSSTILLTEAIIDALTLYEQGFKNVIPCYGVNGLSEDHLICFQQFGVKEAILCFDADEAGQRGAVSVANRLSDIGISCSILTLPDKDINDYFRRHTPEAFETLVKQAHPLTPIRSESVVSRAEVFFEPTEAGFRIGFGDRIYEVKGVHRQGVQLRVTLLCRRELKGILHLDAVDLYSARARERFSKEAAFVLKEREEQIREDLIRLMAKVEKGLHPSQGVNWSFEETVEPTGAIYEAARKFLTNLDIFSELLADLDALGLVGEEKIKLIGYLVCTSRKLEHPLSLLIQSRSAAGKSACAEALLSLMPSEDVRRWTRLTDQALFYQGEKALAHKLVVIEELSGMGGAAYSIRAMASSGVLSQATVIKDPVSGEMRGYERKVPGPVAFMITTTQAHLDEETASRFLTVAPDESANLTEQILMRQREDQTVAGYLRHSQREVIIAKHHAAQRMIRPLLVLDPHAPGRGSDPPQGTLPPQGFRCSLWARRDQPKMLRLVQAVALLHQHQREVKRLTTATGHEVEYIEVEETDWKRAEPLIVHLMEGVRSELPAPSRALLRAIEQEAEQRCMGLSLAEVSFTRRGLRELMGWSIGQIKLYLPPLVEQEYLWVRHGKKGQEYRYEIPLPKLSTTGQ